MSTASPLFPLLGIWALHHRLGLRAVYFTLISVFVTGMFRSCLQGFGLRCHCCILFYCTAALIDFLFYSTTIWSDEAGGLGPGFVCYMRINLVTKFPRGDYFQIVCTFKQRNILYVPCQIVNCIHNFTFPFSTIPRHVHGWLHFLYSACCRFLRCFESSQIPSDEPHLLSYYQVRLPRFTKCTGI